MSILVTLRWDTTLTYEREVEIDEDEFKASGMDMESYVSENLDELVADLEEDYEDGKLTAVVGDRELSEVLGYEEEGDDDGD